jgi:hypothetical protein
VRRDWSRDDARIRSGIDNRSTNDEGAGCTTQFDNTHGTGFRELTGAYFDVATGYLSAYDRDSGTFARLIDNHPAPSLSG